MSGTWVAPLAQGLGVTLAVFAGASVLAILSGLLIGTATTYGAKPLRIVCRGYVDIMRGTSALVQLFWVVFALPLIGIRFDPLLASMVVLGLNSGAYASEAVRGALQAVAIGQREAAAVLGLNPLQTWLRNTLPQAIPIVLPTATNLAVELLKNTSLVALLGLADLTFQANTIRTATLADVSVLSTLLIIYLVLALGVVRLGRWAEQRATRWRPVMSGGRT
jgi:polar amino acid transport system permease protein